MRCTVPSGISTSNHPPTGWRSPRMASARTTGARGVRPVGSTGRRPRVRAPAGTSAWATDPSDGTKSGFLWNGTRFLQRRSASTWINEITCRGING